MFARYGIMIFLVTINEYYTRTVMNSSYDCES